MPPERSRMSSRGRTRVYVSAWSSNGHVHFYDSKDRGVGSAADAAADAHSRREATHGSRGDSTRHFGSGGRASPWGERQPAFWLVPARKTGCIGAAHAHARREPAPGAG